MYSVGMYVISRLMGFIAKSEKILPTLRWSQYVCYILTYVALVRHSYVLNTDKRYVHHLIRLIKKKKIRNLYKTYLYNLQKKTSRNMIIRRSSNTKIVCIRK